MKYLVLVKQVPDTSLIRVDVNGNIIRTGVPSMLDPFSESAMRLANRMKKDGDVVVAVTMGPPQAGSALRRCFEIGADECYLLSDRDFAGADTFATSRTLVAFINRHCSDYDMILAGTLASDGGTSQVPAQISQMLDIRFISNVIKIDGSKAIQDMDSEYISVELPERCVMSVSLTMTDPFIPSIKGFLDSVDREMITLGRVDLGLGAYSVGTKGSKTHIVKVTVPTHKRDCRIIDKDPKAVAEHLKGVLDVQL